MIRDNVVKLRPSNGHFRQFNLNSTVNRHKNNNVYGACSKITYMFYVINDQDVCCPSLSNFRPTFVTCFLVCLDVNLHPYDDRSKFFEKPIKLLLISIMILVLIKRIYISSLIKLQILNKSYFWSYLIFVFIYANELFKDKSTVQYHLQGIINWHSTG